MKWILLVALVFNIQLVFAWGPTGHRAVGEIAQQNLNKNALKKINEILENENLAMASTWSDEIKSDPDNYRKTFSWHYTDWPKGQKKYSYKNNSGSLIKSIQDQINTLKNKKTSNFSKKFALRFLVHLMGDLHQPLHVGNGKDRGGNDCKVRFHNNETNLHRLWDEGMINFTKLSYTEFVTFVSLKFNNEVITNKIELEKWAEESRDLRLTLYPAEVLSDWKKTDQINYSYCRRGFDHKTEDLPNLSYQYSYKFLPVVENRIYLGGRRLAVILNQIF